VASLTSNRFRKLMMDGDIDLVNDSGIKVMLTTAAYTPNKDHNFASQVTNELSGTGYAGGFNGSGRKALASRAVTQDDSNDWSYFDAADLTWTAINAGTVGYAIVIKEVTADSDSPILVVVDVSPDIVTNGGDYTIQWASDGICKNS
jgi:hypothetical protein